MLLHHLLRCRLLPLLLALVSAGASAWVPNGRNETSAPCVVLCKNLFSTIGCGSSLYLQNIVSGMLHEGGTQATPSDGRSGRPPLCDRIQCWRKTYKCPWTPALALRL